MKNILLFLFLVLFQYSCASISHFNHESIKCPPFYGQSIQHKINVNTFDYNPPGNGSIGQNEITITGNLPALLNGYSSQLFDSKISKSVSIEIEKALQASGIAITKESKCKLSGEIFLINFSVADADTTCDIKYILKNAKEENIFEARLKVKHEPGIIAFGTIDQLLSISIHKNVYKLLSMNTFIEALSKCDCNK